MASKGVPVPSRRRRTQLTCTVCGKPYWTHRYRAAKSKFCSKTCWANRRTALPCELCGKDRGSNLRFCSKACTNKVMVGPKASRWKDGSSLDKDRAKYGTELKAWRIAVYIRDGFTCMDCGNKGIPLNAHHIKHWATHPDLRFVVSNGKTLCEPCHDTAHGRMIPRQRRTRVCPNCFGPTKGRGKGGLCRSCAITTWHAQRAPDPGSISADLA